MLGASDRQIADVEMLRARLPQSAPLRRAQVSFGAMWASESAFMVGLGVVAFRTRVALSFKYEA